MVEFSLPRNSVVGKGKTYPAPAGATNVKTFRVYRWSPDDDSNPVVDSYEIDLDHIGPMVLDAIIHIKNDVDPTLTFRRSCREGICGSCAMNIDGENTLACLKPIKDVKGDVRINPLPHMPIVKDLVSNLDAAYAQLRSIEPWMKSDSAPPPDSERRQSIEERAKLDGMWECILCFCCTTSCPSYWWNGQKQIAFNCIPQIDRFMDDGATKEEWKMTVETRKILDPDISVIATCVRVPVFIGHSEAVVAEFEEPVDLERAREALREADGVILRDERVDGGYVTPTECVGEDATYVSRLRLDPTVPNGLAFWCVSDNLRKGAALNAVQIAETMVALDLLPKH